jgi:NarL family two-component system response regulator LiaR
MIRTLIVDDNRITGTVLAAVLAEEPDVDIVGVAGTIEETAENISRCDVIVVSTGIPEDAALEIARLSVACETPVKTLVMGIPESEDVILRYIEAGAAGFVLKDDSIEGLVETMHAVYKNEAIIPPNLAAKLMHRVAELARAYDGIGGLDSEMNEDLTRREQEVLDLICEGRTNQEIADTLIIELGTVKNHVHNILKKLNVNSRREAAMFAQMNAPRPSLTLEA